MIWLCCTSRCADRRPCSSTFSSYYGEPREGDGLDRARGRDEFLDTDNAPTKQQQQQQQQRRLVAMARKGQWDDREGYQGLSVQLRPSRLDVLPSHYWSVAAWAVQVALALGDGLQPHGSVRLTCRWTLRTY